jgi:beta-galactosidase
LGTFHTLRKSLHDPFNTQGNPTRKDMIPKLIPLALLTAIANAWQPAPDSMLTDWGAKITPEKTWREYPRPALAREEWTNLNGLWKYKITPNGKADPPAQWSGDILVPFAIESALSGVKKRISPEQALWYRRDLPTLPKPEEKRTLLHFEAVDYQSTVWINNTKVGENTGGIYTQTTDVEPEINGLIIYDRKIHKLSTSKLAEIVKASGLME